MTRRGIAGDEEESLRAETPKLMREMRLKYRCKGDFDFPLVLGVCPDDGEELAHHFEGAAHCPRCRQWFGDATTFIPEVQVYLSAMVASDRF